MFVSSAVPASIIGWGHQRKMKRRRKCASARWLDGQAGNSLASVIILRSSQNGKLADVFCFVFNIVRKGIE